MENRGEDSDETGFKWGVNFFLEQRISLDFIGMQIESLELIGYDPGRRPNPGADENVNVPHDISGRRLK